MSAAASAFKGKAGMRGPLGPDPIYEYSAYAAASAVTMELAADYER